MKVTKQGASFTAVLILSLLLIVGGLVLQDYATGFMYYVWPAISVLAAITFIGLIAWFATTKKQW